MFKLFTKKIKASLLLSTLIALNVSLAHSATIDLNKEIKIAAKRQATDLKNKIASYIDNVIITQGSLSINADRVQVISRPNSEYKIYIATGKPAIFEQLLEDGQPIKMQANEIKYDEEKHTITIAGNASVSQEGSLVSGNKIVYNTVTEQLTAESSSDDTVTTILQPQNSSENTKPNNN
jgi:lipopolysaccharide export system protein LptA